MSSSPSVDEFLANSQELRKRCRMTSKIHYNQEEVCRAINFCLGLTAAVFGALTAATQSAVSADIPPLLLRISPILTGVAAAALAYLEPASMAGKYHAAGVQYGELERRARTWEIGLQSQLAVGARSEQNIEAARASLEQLWTTKSQLDKDMPLASELVKMYTQRRVKGKPLDK